ncbi:hypothetical protein ACIRQQ_47670 [Streptomyces fuscichromogenes]|uniref:hypothetical protein n=1 Tax=Streptomyces fuscichromogenes TaxID=1324013 RepID=UPI0037F92850
MRRSPSTASVGEFRGLDTAHAESIEPTGSLGSGALDISVLQPESWPLDEINDVISGVSSGESGFTSYLVEI